VENGNTGMTGRKQYVCNTAALLVFASCSVLSEHVENGNTGMTGRKQYVCNTAALLVFAS